ncbi:hypothetical protein VPH35_042355 [Triticum aestivum]
MSEPNRSPHRGVRNRDPSPKPNRASLILPLPTAPNRASLSLAPRLFTPLSPPTSSTPPATHRPHPAPHPRARSRATPHRRRRRRRRAIPRPAVRSAPPQVNPVAA